MELTNKIKVITSDGLECIIESINITELGYMKVKIYIESEKRWISYIWTGGLNALLHECGFKLNGPVTI